MYNILKVIGITVGMFILSLVAGFLPTTLSHSTNNAIAIYGGGILVGTALLIVLPESVKLLLEAD